MVLIRSIKAWVAAALALAFSACSPALHDDGYFTCVDDKCPTGWHCHSDHACYSTPETDGAAAEGGGGKAAGGAGKGSGGKGGTNASAGSGAGEGAAGDGAAGDAGGSGSGGGSGTGAGAGGSGGGTLITYQACGDGSDTCGAGLMCGVGPDVTATHGACISAATCGSDSECATVGGQDGACAAMHCFPKCDSDSDCTAPRKCYGVAGPSMGVERACLEIVSEDLFGTTTCTVGTQGGCGAGMGCLARMSDPNGMCSMPCTGASDTCPGSPNSDCKKVVPDRWHCMLRCSSDSECGALKCKRFMGDSVSHCMPPAWDDTSLPP